MSKNDNGKYDVQPLYSRITSLKAETNDLLYVIYNLFDQNY